MAGSNLAGLCNVFGEAASNRMKFCEFHFKDQRNKRAKKLDDESAEDLKSLCDSLLKAATVPGYESIKKQLDHFVDRLRNRELRTWVEWWHQRRGFIFRAFTPVSAPEMNQAEVIHAGMGTQRPTQVVSA